MYLRHAVLLTAVLVMPACAALSPGDEHLSVHSTGTQFVISVPISDLRLRFDKGGLTAPPARQESHDRYFWLEDERSRLVVSGWFEPERLYPGLRSLWQKSLAASRKQDIPEPVAVEFDSIRGHDAVFYSYDFGPNTQTHVRLAVVESGTWIDLHLSVTSNGTHAGNRQQLESMLSTMTIEKK